MAGNLTITPFSATLIRDTDYFDKMDPYVVLKLGASFWKSPICHGGGKNPAWTGASTSFKRTNEDLLTIELWDKDNASNDDMIAQGTFLVNKVEKVGTLSEWVPLTHKGKDAGKILLKIDFFADGGAKG